MAGAADDGAVDGAPEAAVVAGEAGESWSGRGWPPPLRPVVRAEGLGSLLADARVHRRDGNSRLRWRVSGSIVSNGSRPIRVLPKNSLGPLKPVHHSPAPTESWKCPEEALSLLPLELRSSVSAVRRSLLRTFGLME